MRSLVARAIAMDGHETVTAEDGAEALDILTREHGAFDLLLTDIQMPVMDGIALALSAARDFPDLVILLMTGYAAQRERAYFKSRLASPPPEGRNIDVRFFNKRDLAGHA